MSLPAALTWLQLLPKGTRFACAGAPPWFERMVREHASDGDSPTAATVAWGRRWLEFPDEPRERLPIVGINTPVMGAPLASLDYTYVRRFAVLPTLETARWFIPLDAGGRVAEAAFSLYTPSRRSARLKKAVAKKLARWRVPAWYRDEVVIASPQPPPLERKLAELFPGKTIRLALSSGAPEPAINRKPSAAVIDGGGNVLAFVKIAASAISRHIVEHEAEMLAGLRLRPNLAGRAPQLLFAGEVDGRYLTVQSPLPGLPAPTTLHEHVEFLYAMWGPEKPASETRMVANLRDRLAALVPARADLVDAFDAILPTLEQMTVPSTIVHGDFAPWNLRLHDGKISAFDWEYGETDGLPRIDEIHFRLQTGLELRKWSVDEALRTLRRMAAPEWMPHEEERMRAVQAIYLLDHLARLLGEGYTRHHDIVSTYEQLLARLSVPRREVVLA